MKKYTYLLEVFVFFVVLSGANHLLFPEIPNFMGVDPSPYWAGVLLFGFRYGVAGGFVAGMAAAVLYLLTTWLFLERYLFEDAVFYIRPALFVIIGTVIGLGVRRYRQNIQDLEEQAAHKETQSQRLQDEFKVAKEVNAGLEKRIVTRMSTLITLYQGALALSNDDINELYPAILEFVAKTLDASEVALYLRVSDGWQLQQSIGWQEYHRRPSFLKTNEGITGLAGTRNKIVSVRDFVGTAEINNIFTDSLLAGPIHGSKNDVVAVISIQNMSFLNFNSATISLFNFLLDWVSRSVSHAQYVADLQAKEIVDPKYQVYSYPYFLSRAEQELTRSKTYYLPLSVGLVGVSGLATLSKGLQENLLTILAELLRYSCRDMDVIARCGSPETPFAFLLITASAAQAKDIRQRIIDNFNALKLGQENSAYAAIQLHFGFSDFTPQTTDVSGMLAQAQEEFVHVV